MTPARSISVIMPVLAEAGVIAAALDGIEAIRDVAKVEVVVVDGDAAGSTLAAIPAGAHPNLVTLTASRGRASQMNAGARAASGDILVFLHADTRLPAGGFAAITDAVAAGTRLGAFRLAIDDPHPWLRQVAWTANLRTTLTRIPYGDQAQFFTREAFAALDGYPEVELMEDVRIMQAARAKGWRPALLPLAVRTSARRWRSEGLLRCTLRNWLVSGLHALGVPPHRLARLYRFPRPVKEPRQ